MIKNIFTRFFTDSARAIPWKNNEFYYNYPFSNKLDFIDHTKRYPIFRALDTEGNLLNPEYDVLEKNLALRMLRAMVAHREMDKFFLASHRQGRISFYFSHYMEEAFGPAVGAALDDSDVVVLQGREHGIPLWRGYTAEDLMHSTKGSKDDMTLGKGLTFHFANPEKNIMPLSAPMGSKVGHASGAGYAFRVKGLNRVALSVVGDGAASQGDHHAGLNFAATLGSQTIFVCRNNGYAISVPISDQYAGDGIASRGIGYGMPAIRVDGCDTLAMYNAIKEARKKVIERKGPVLVETQGYRGADHSTSDSVALYRTKEVLEKLKPYLDSIGDPLHRFGMFVQKKGWISDIEAYSKEIKDETAEMCRKVVEKVALTPFPNYKIMFDGVFKDKPWNIREQEEELEVHLKKHPDCYPLDEFDKSS